MGATLVSSNTTLKVNRAITGATTVNSNSYAIVDYFPTSYPTKSDANSNTSPSAMLPYTRYFGPSQSVPSTFTVIMPVFYAGSGAASTVNVTYTLQSGVEFINTP